jgi:hypothetical protein
MNQYLTTPSEFAEFLNAMRWTWLGLCDGVWLAWEVA